MKKIYMLMIVALFAGSCQVSDPSPKVVDRDDLRDYSFAKMGECVAMPSEVLETAIGFDAYLRASNEDKMADKEYYGMISDYGNNTYGIRSSVRNISLTVDTKGKSIWDADAAWEFAAISFYDSYSGTDTYIDLSCELSEGATLVKEDAEDSLWTFSYKDRISSHVRLLPADSLYCWRVVASCREESENGMSSVSSTDSQGITIMERWEGAGTLYPYKTNSFSGKFMTEISRNNEVTDWCTANFRPGFTTGVTTSRDQ